MVPQGYPTPPPSRKVRRTRSKPTMTSATTPVHPERGGLTSEPSSLLTTPVGPLVWFSAAAICVGVDEKEKAPAPNPHDHPNKVTTEVS